MPPVPRVYGIGLHLHKPSPWLVCPLIVHTTSTPRSPGNLWAPVRIRKLTDRENGSSIMARTA